MSRQAIEENNAKLISALINDDMDQWAGIQSFLLDLGDEALQLMESI